MRGYPGEGVGAEALASISPTEASFALAVQESPFMQISALMERNSLAGTGNIKNHVELNAAMPDMEPKFDNSMPLAQAQYNYERYKIKREFEKNMSYAPRGAMSKAKMFAGSVVGSMVDPIGNILGMVAGPALKAAGLVGKSLVSRIAIQTADNFIGNMAADSVSGFAASELGDEFDATDRIATNFAASALFGAVGGTFEHMMFREAPQLGKEIADRVESRALTGLNPEGVKEIYNAHIAAENSGTHFSYEHGPFDQKRPFYSGSTVYNEDFPSAAHAIRDGEVVTERGVQLFANENLAHAGALTAGSGPNGSVFTHDISNKVLIDGETKLASLGSDEAVAIHKKALEAGLSSDVLKARDPSISTAYRDVIKAYYAKRVSAEEVQAFEAALKADGIHFDVQDFHGNKQADSHMVYLFDRSKVDSPLEIKSADPRAVGKMTPERLMQIRAQVNGEDKIFNYELKFNKKYGAEMWTKVRESKKAPKLKDNGQLDLTATTSQVDKEFAEVSQRLKEADQFEGHVDATTKKIMEQTAVDFKEASKLPKIYSTIKGCL